MRSRRNGISHFLGVLGACLSVAIGACPQAAYAGDCVATTANCAPDCTSVDEGGTTYCTWKESWSYRACDNANNGCACTETFDNTNQVYACKTYRKIKDQDVTTCSFKACENGSYYSYNTGSALVPTSCSKSCGSVAN